MRPKKQILSDIRVGNELVKNSESIKFLGIILDMDLQFKKFIAIKVRNAYFNIKKSIKLENS